ncbi:hypothetical protein PSN45_005076 [Yamadazyma tenuis]|nr:hypothetical protein PSN45_005076 [Yamadazyma tenuis]
MDYQALLSKGLTSVKKSLDAEQEALANLSHQYKTDEFSQIQLMKSLDVLFAVNMKGGKVVMCGVGKSFKIASKLCATLNSLSIQSVTLHPTEALHGDLGILNNRDTIIMLTASGNTPELLDLLTHIPEAIPIVLLTCNKDSKLATHPKTKSLLYTELAPHLREETIHGVPAPTVSATVALALADSVILALSELIEQSESARKKLFSIKHPGGSIGANLSHLNENVNLSNPRRKISNSSYSSFLSLEQARSIINNSSDPSSSVSSDDDDINESQFDSTLTLEIKAAKDSNVQRLNSAQLQGLSELEFVKHLLTAEYFVTSNKGKDYGVDVATLKKSYLKHSSTGRKWEEFSSGLESEFKPLCL